MRLELWFESDWFFCNVTSQDGFEGDCQETKFQLITF